MTVMDSDAHDLDGILAIEVRLHASSTADTSPRPLFLGGVEPGGIDVWGEVRGGGSNNLHKPGDDSCRNTNHKLARSVRSNV